MILQMKTSFLDPSHGYLLEGGLIKTLLYRGVQPSPSLPNCWRMGINRPRSALWAVMDKLTSPMCPAGRH